MTNSVVKNILSARFPTLKDTSLDSFTKNATYLKLDKGTKLIFEGKQHHYFYLILEGSVKSFYQKDSKKVCLWFAFKNESVATIRTFEGQTSFETIELLESSELLRFKTSSIKELAKTDLLISRLITNLITEHAQFLEQRLYELQFKSSEERYKTLISHTPEILQKVSLTDIASFLGISRETLSRIRKKK